MLKPLAFIASAMVVLGIGLAACSTPAPAEPKPYTGFTGYNAPAYTAPEVPAQLPASAYYTAPVAAAPAEPTYQAAEVYPLTEVTSGTYLVGSEITAGRYVTEGASYCYFARLRDLDGGLSSIIDNGNPRGHTTIKVGAKDVALEVKGNCSFRKI
jgi:hypothetical protein